MRMSETGLGPLFDALSKAQGEMRAAVRDRDNPFYKSQYATLAAVIEALRGPFSKHGLSFTQPVRVEEGGRVVVMCVIGHKDGGWISGEATAVPTKNDPQGVGSLISYLRRYLLQSMAGLASADDDAEGAMGRTEAPKPQQNPFPPRNRRKTAKQNRK